MTASKNKPCPPTSPHGWTIDTLKELVDQKLEALRSELGARDKALDLQAAENKRRLDELNHEHTRVAQAQETYVSKDTWESFTKADQVWKSTTDRTLQSALPRIEFQAYKDSTEKALTLKAGQSQGIGSVGATIVQIVAACASVGTMIGIVMLFIKKG